MSSTPIAPPPPFHVVAEVHAASGADAGAATVAWTAGGGADAWMKTTITCTPVDSGTATPCIKEVDAPKTAAEYDALSVYHRPPHSRFQTKLRGLEPGVTYAVAVTSTSSRSLTSEAAAVAEAVVMPKAIFVPGTPTITAHPVLGVVGAMRIDLVAAEPAPCGDRPVKYIVTSFPRCEGALAKATSSGGVPRCPTSGHAMCISSGAGHYADYICNSCRGG